MVARQGSLHSPLLFSTVLGVPASAIKQEKEIKGIQIGKKQNVPLLGDIIIYIENLKESTKKIFLKAS